MNKWVCIGSCLGFGLAFVFIGLFVKLSDYVPGANIALFIVGLLVFISGLSLMAFFKFLEIFGDL